MFITRATRHDKADLEEFFKAEEWGDPVLDQGVAFIARDGAIVGNVRLIEIDPQTLIVEDVLVKSDRRGAGIGANVMQAAMNSRGGTLYLCCHPERIRFYTDLGFSEMPFEELPDPIKAYFEEHGDSPDKLPPDHIHHFMKAR
jgi:N-acetylglutamate synthase-like GNAT family acetyltransferase